MERVGASDKRWLVVNKNHSNMGMWRLLLGKCMGEGHIGAQGQEGMEGRGLFPILIAVWQLVRCPWSTGAMVVC